MGHTHRYKFGFKKIKIQVRSPSPESRVLETGSDPPIRSGRDSGHDTVYKQLGLGELKPTNITLSLADQSVKIPKGIVEDLLVKVDKFYYLVDFVVLDTEPIASRPNHVQIILGRPFLATSNAIINFRNGVMQLTFGNMTLELNIFHLSKKHKLVEDDNQGTDEVCSIDPNVEKPNVHKL